MNNTLVFLIIWGVITILILGQSLVNTFSTLQINQKLNSLNSQLCALKGGSCKQNSNIMVETYYNYWDYIVSGLLIVAACFLTVFVNAIIDPADLGNIDPDKRTFIIGLIWAVTFTLVLFIITFWQWVYPTWINVDNTSTNNDSSPTSTNDDEKQSAGFQPLENNWEWILSGIVLITLVFLTVFKDKVFKGDNKNKKCGFMWLGGLVGIIIIDFLWAYIIPQFIWNYRD